MKQHLCAAAALASALVGASLPAAAMAPATTTFSEGTEGWVGPEGSGGRSGLTRFRGT
jgi:hypothetical protein